MLAAGERLVPRPTGTGRPPVAGARVLVPPNFEPVVAVIVEQIANLKEHDEWEIKMGIETQSGFESGLTKQQLKRIITWANAECERKDSGLVSTGKWQETSDLHYQNNIRVTVFQDAGDGTAPKKQIAIRKLRESDVDITVMDHPITIRSSVKREIPAVVQFVENPDPVRLKKRLSYEYRGCIRIDITLVWQGRSEGEARANPSKHEIELEFIDRGVLHTQGARWAALSMLLKVVYLIHQAYETDCDFERTLLVPSLMRRHDEK